MDDRDLTLEELQTEFPEVWEAYFQNDLDNGTVDEMDDETYEDYVRRHMRFYIRAGKIRVNDVYHPCEFTWVPEIQDWDDLGGDDE